MDPCFPYSVWNFPSMLCRWQQIYEPNPDHEQTFLLSRVKRAYTLIFEGPEVDAWLEKKSSMDLTCTNYFKSIPRHFALVDQVHVDHWLCHPGEGNGIYQWNFQSFSTTLRKMQVNFFTETQFFKTAFPDPHNLFPLSL